MIRNLTVSEITTSSVFLDWDEPLGNRFYFNVQWFGDKTREYNTSDTSHNITGLSAGVNYTFMITTVAADSTRGDPVIISLFTSMSSTFSLK